MRDSDKPKTMRISTGAAVNGRDAERRGGGRIKCAGAVCQFGNIADVSGTGVKILTKGRPPCEVGEVLHVKFDNDGETIAFPARLSRIKQTKDGLFELGFRFWNLNEIQSRQLTNFARNSRARWGHGFRLAG